MASELAKAICSVMAEVGKLPKNGWNDYGKYHYPTETDALDLIRPLLAKQGVAVFFNCEKVEYVSDNAKVGRVHVIVSYEMVHAESGESKVTNCPGDGVDKSNPDKALYKAITGATKYWVFKTFLLSFGDDPERDQQPQPQKTVHRQSNKVSDLSTLVQKLVERCLAEDIPLGDIADKHGLPRKPNEYQMDQYKQLSKLVDEYEATQQTA